MYTHAITDTFADQYARQWQMLRATIERLDDARWREGDGQRCPAVLALHALLWADFYIQDDPKAFQARARFGVSDNDPAAQMPERAAVLAYLDDLAARTDAWLRGLDEATLFGAEPLFPWTGATVLERIVYTLRHTTYHLGELSYVLRVEGAEQTEWV